MSRKDRERTAKLIVESLLVGQGESKGLNIILTAIAHISEVMCCSPKRDVPLQIQQYDYITIPQFTLEKCLIL